MNIANHYYYFKSALSHRFCDHIIHYANSQKESMALTGGFSEQKKLSKEDIKNLQRKRKSDLVWLSENWIYREIQNYVKEANEKAGWNFQWDRTESCQFTKYKLGQYYDWHCDSWDKPYDKPGTPDHGKIRKLSMTCQLTDSSEYTGGELEFDFRNYSPNMRDESIHRIQCKEILTKGSIIVFPSFIWHRVKPVTSGTRYSLVAWNIGNPFI